MLKDDIIAYRRHLHQHPELGFHTQQTAAFVRQVLQSYGYKDITMALNDAAVIARLHVGKSQTIAFRADLDALPITEQTGLSFASAHQGIMHACGHDAHTAMLLGAAKLLHDAKDSLTYNIVLIFQPAEEGPLRGGALNLLKEVDLHDVSFFYAFHVTNRLPSGVIGIKLNEACAAPDLWELEITGKGSHAATPSLGHSPILPAAEIALEFEKLEASLMPSNTVISTTYINSGVSMNVICDQAHLKGTARSFSQTERDFLKTKMTEIADRIAEKYHTTAKFCFHYAYDPVYNDEIAAQKMIQAARKILTEKNVVLLEKPEMVGEDFAYYRKIAPICLSWFGVRGENQAFSDLHSSSFMLDEEALEKGALLYLTIACS